ncbi:MAG: COG2426 family protein, partial [Fibrobacterota bacterium]
PVGILGSLPEAFHLPFGLRIGGMGMHWLPVFFICVLSNALLGPVIYFLLINFTETVIKFRPLGRVYDACVYRIRKKASGLKEKYTLIGIALFIAVPLPGSGSYSGALLSSLIGLSFAKFCIANTIGVIIAGAVVTLAVAGGQGLFKLFY